jgi:hypothetical protein
MLIRIAEVEAFAAALPAHATLDSDAGLTQALLPRRELCSGNGEGKMHASAAVVRRNQSARHLDGFKRAATTK